MRREFAALYGKIEFLAVLLVRRATQGTYRGSGPRVQSLELLMASLRVLSVAPLTIWMSTLILQQASTSTV